MKRNVYLIGIGGIGMSALARYFLHEGWSVAGYDRTPSPLTAELESEGAAIHYEDNTELIPTQFLAPEETLVVYTPAIPTDHSELCMFRQRGFEVMKRSEVLGHLAGNRYVMAVAGTHGKTSTTTLVAWLNERATKGGNAFLGGISKNFGSNLVLGSGPRFAVEADEFDRSFLRLHPDVAVITSADADHLDIYGTVEALHEAFEQFIRQIKPGGTLIIKQGVELRIDNPSITTYTYALDAPADFHVRNASLCDDGCYRFDIVCPDRILEGCKLGVVGRINMENCVAAVAAIWAAGEWNEEALREALAEFRGVKRRLECWINTPDSVYIDDYAHHPEELRATITSLREIFKRLPLADCKETSDSLRSEDCKGQAGKIDARSRKITAVFQPHLYTRTRDFHEEFAGALSLADEVILLPIYPAREEPIEGVSSELIARGISVPHRIVPKEQIVEELASMPTDVVVTFGAGDIDRYCSPIAQRLSKKR